MRMMRKFLLDHDIDKISQACSWNVHEMKDILSASPKAEGGLGIQELVNLSDRFPGKYPERPDLFFQDRLKTLMSVDDAVGAMSPEKLTQVARAGLYRWGKTTTLACYHCGCQATDWLAGDDPWNRHAELQPNCPVVKRGVVIWPEGGMPVNHLLRRSLSQD
ncbi:baculoviral IAP repeat-containing protein 3-like [Haliotis cracherodii]|uniref:baculoviral IAP repeat-containing protein 3-like n=1 Tax=Haliotis cracherodii TaxID=6455 RepID=UPI0039E85425